MADVRRALVHGCAVFAALAALARRPPKAAGPIAVAIAALDLMLANSGLVWTVPRADLERPLMRVFAGPAGGGEPGPPAGQPTASTR